MKNTDEYLNNLRHSAAHLLAAAVMELWPNTKRTIGPAIEDGFYFDFDFGDVKISEANFPEIERRMHELVVDWKEFRGKEVTTDEALSHNTGNEYKAELIKEFSNDGQHITIYTSGNYTDLCRGGHCEHPDKELKYFKLLSTAGAYWRGNEKNKMLTRIYGTVFPSQNELDSYIAMQEEAKKRDHRKLGAELDLFVFSDLVGKGLPILTPYGAAIRRSLERFIVDEELKRGYAHVYSPPLAKVELYKTSGHYPYYKDTMYPVMKIDDEELILRPMTCPHHFMLYKSRPRSYRELPMRIAEISPQFRYEKSGELTGLIRVRTFILSDAHIVTAKGSAKEEISGVLDLIDYINTTLGLTKGVDYRYRLSLGNRNDSKKYYKDDASWDHAEGMLRQVLSESNAPFFEAADEAAFYGPKIDVQMKNVNGKEDTAFTVQYDFVMPKRFELKFINDEGNEEEPVVIHRASLGAFERTMAFLIERYGGSFPTWLAPVQVKVLPIADRHLEYAKGVMQTLRNAGIRVELDSRSERLQAKIRDAQLFKVPYMVICGDTELQNGTVSVRTRSGENTQAVNTEAFRDDVLREIGRKKPGA
jgi:threonyl-tRNA synthetase